MLIIIVLLSRGLFITINDIGHIYEILCNWPEQDVKVKLLKIIDLNEFQIQ